MQQRAKPIAARHTVTAADLANACKYSLLLTTINLVLYQQ